MRYAKDQEGHKIDAHNKEAVSFLLEQGHRLHCTCCDAKVFYKPSQEKAPHFSSYKTSDHDKDCLMRIETQMNSFRYLSQQAEAKGREPVIRATANTVIINDRIFEHSAFYEHNPMSPRHRHKGGMPIQGGKLRIPRIGSAHRFLEFVNANRENQTLNDITFKYRGTPFKAEQLYFDKSKYKQLYTAGLNHPEENLPMYFIEISRYRERNVHPHKKHLVGDSVTVSGQKDCKYAIRPIIHFHDAPDGSSTAKEMRKKFNENKNNIIWAKPHINVPDEQRTIDNTRKSDKKTGVLQMHFNIYSESQFAGIPSKNEPVKQIKLDF